MRRRAFGLRPRLLAALVLTAAVTLGVAALALLSPLEQRLRTDGEANVLNAVSAAVPRYARVPLDRRSNEPDVAALRAEDLALRRTANAQVTVLDPQLTQIDQAGPDPELAEGFGDVLQALSTGRANHSLTGDALLVAEPVRIGGRLFGVAVRRRLSYVASAVSSVRSAFLKAAAVGLVVALVLGIAFSRTLLRRLERLRDATRELERQGLDAVPAVDPGRDEIGELARAFAGMHEQLRRQEAARRAFVATASHELRTPLASLEGMLELLDDDLEAGHLDLEDARERTTRAKEQTHRLARLATDLLDLSRLDADVELRTEPLELGELCRAVAAEFELRATRARVELEKEPPPQPCWVSADPGSVARIIRILIDNALHVAPLDSAVGIRMTCGQISASVTVSDCGPGVREDERQLIFERFQRGSDTAGKSGFGLGLAIGRELAERMGGALELEPVDPSRDGPGGARFTLRLPAAVMTAVSEVAR